MTPLLLSKLHATGNDFLVFDGREAPGGVAPGLDPAVVAALCDRHRGVGADGVITLGPGRDGADCTMTLQNADGGPAEVSGNGLRCLALAAARAGVTGLAGSGGPGLAVDTAVGRRLVDLERDSGGEVTGADVDMGPVTFDPALIPLDAGSAFDLTVVVGPVSYRGDAAGVGNPHLVLLVDDPDAVPVGEHGPRIEHDPRFPRRANVEFVTVAGADALTMRVWERGVGETLSCGTGACAAAAVAHRRGLVGDRVSVRVPGGVLRVTLGETVRLGGPVVHVFDVEVDPQRLLAGRA